MVWKKIEMKEGDLPDKYKTHTFTRGVDHPEPVSGNVIINLQEAIEQILGPAGRMISSSKSTYVAQLREAGADDKRLKKVYFNACIFNDEGKQVWFGDLDIYEDIDLLQQVANQFGKIYIAHEYPYRWNGILGHEGDPEVITLRALTE